MARTTPSEKLRRVRSVAEALVQGRLPTDIVRYSSVNWTIGKRAAEKYISAAYKLLYDQAVKSIDQSKAFHQKARLDLYRTNLELRTQVFNSTMTYLDKVDAIAKLDNRILAILKDMARIDALYVERHELSGPDGKPLFNQNIQIVFQAPTIQPITSEEQMDKIIEKYGEATTDS